MNKIEKIQSELKLRDLDAAIITKPTNIYYLTGFDCDPHERLLILVIKQDKIVMLVPAMELERAKKAVNFDLVSYLDTENGFKILQEKTSNLKNVFVEKEYMSIDRYEKLKENMAIESILSIDSMISDMRKYKGEEEIAKIKKAAEYADLAFEIAKKNFKVGITENELKSIIEFEVKKQGAEAMSFDTIVLFGANASDPHGISGDTKLLENDMILIDLGVWYQGYASDETRTFYFGNKEKISSEAKEIYEIVKKANMEAIKAVKPGVRFCDLDKIARDIITEAGYGEYFNHRLGHGLGLEVHEYPDVSSATKDKLEVGMVFTIEPGVYKPGVAGVRIEDDIVVTENGYRILTEYDKD